MSEAERQAEHEAKIGRAEREMMDDGKRFIKGKWVQKYCPTCKKQFADHRDYCMCADASLEESANSLRTQLTAKDEEIKRFAVREREMRGALEAAEAITGIECKALSLSSKDADRAIAGIVAEAEKKYAPVVKFYEDKIKEWSHKEIVKTHDELRRFYERAGPGYPTGPCQCGVCTKARAKALPGGG